MKAPAAVLILLGLGAAAVGGCSPGAVARVHKMEMQVFPAAIDLDGRPGADGWQVRVYLYRLSGSGRVEAVRVSGTLELLLFDGQVAAEALLKARPRQQWSFSGPELRRRAVHGLAGWSYPLRLTWNRPVEPGRRVTLVARYKPPGGPWLYSRPNASLAGGQK